jgi:methylmalonyl-CoA mutase N-terminal domain/subunit
MTDISKIRKQRADWESTTLKKALDRFPERRERFETPSGQEVARLYGPEHTAEMDYVNDLGFPGDYPFTRGVQPTMYRGRFWTMRQYAGFATAAETNQRYRYLLERGQTGLSVAFDLPTQMGYDSDHEMAQGEVGRTGVAIDSLEDMERLFDQIPLGDVSTSMTINSTAAVLLSMYLALCERQGVEPRKIRGTIQNDILKEYIARGTYIFPPAPSMRIITDLFSYCKDKVPSWNPISISGYHIPRRPRRWPSRSSTASPTCRRPWTPGWPWTASPGGSPSSSRRTQTSSRRWPSSGRPGGSGRAS